MDRRRVKSIFAWILSVLLTLAFMGAAIPKLAGVQVWLAKFTNWGYPNWFPFAVGSLELLGGILLLIPRVSILGASLLGVIMIGAAYTHLANGEGPQVLRPILMMVLLGIVAWLRRRESNSIQP